MSLAQAVVDELADARFDGLIHGTRSAAEKGGCHGPLCRKFHRDKRRRARAAQTGNPIPPATQDDRLLAGIIESHARRVLTERAQDKAKQLAEVS